MKKTFPRPLTIRCEGLSKAIIADLADRLCLLFEDVTIEDDEIICAAPLSGHHYEQAWQLIDSYELEAI